MSASRRAASVLGSTGSVGCKTVGLLEGARDSWQVEALAAGRNAELLARQALSLGAQFAAIADEEGWPVLRDALAGSGIEAAAGLQAVEEAARRPASWVMAAIVGAAGLEPVARALERGATVALANKESLVCAGELLTEMARIAGATIIPVDSEHNAIFQVFESKRPERVRGIVLTASGGPFRTLPLEKLAEVTPKDAVAHPVWKMGAKISVDSATMMNKALEMIEACHLFPVEPEQVRILMHPQSVVHGIVEYVDGSHCAMLGVPDMRIPIAQAMAWPDRMEVKVKPLNLTAGYLTFEEPDAVRFPALGLARQALREGGTAPTILNAANEVAVEAFLRGGLPFPAITAVAETVLQRFPGPCARSLAEVLDVDRIARSKAMEVVGVRALGGTAFSQHAGS